MQSWYDSPNCVVAYNTWKYDTLIVTATSLIGNDCLVESKLLNIYDRRNIGFLEYAQELYDLVPLSPFHFRPTTKSGVLNSYVIDLLPTHFASLFPMFKIKEWKTEFRVSRM